MKTDLYLLPLRAVASLPPDYGAKRFPLRAARAARFLREDDRLRCLGAGALLSAVLGLSEAEITEGEHKKPTAQRPFGFNLSHSGDFVLLAVDGGAVGADVEKIDPSHLDLARTVYRPDELLWMEADPLPRFFTLWTLKESVMKQRGLGFAMPPESFSVMPLIEGRPFEVEGERLFAATVSHCGHAIAVCTAHEIEPPPLRILTAKDLL